MYILAEAGLRLVNDYRNQRIKMFVQHAVAELKAKDRKEKKMILLKDTLCDEVTIQQLKDRNIECILYDSSFHLNDERLMRCDAIILESQQQDCFLAQNLRKRGIRLPIYGCCRHENWETLITVTQAGMNGTMYYPLSAELIEEVIRKEAI